MKLIFVGYEFELPEYAGATCIRMLLMRDITASERKSTGEGL